MDVNENARKARLAALLAKNKTRLARNELITRYNDEFHLLLNSDSFLDLEQSNTIKREVYLKVAKLQGLQTTSFQDIVSELDRLRKSFVSLDDYRIVCYYLDTVQTGGVKIKLKEFCKVVSFIGQKPESEIIVVDEHFSFGICVEILEYDYLFTYWGFY